jgi:hypothetical protein
MQLHCRLDNPFARLVLLLRPAGFGVFPVFHFQ